jgi:hypothetical protein
VSNLVFVSASSIQDTLSNKAEISRPGHYEIIKAMSVFWQADKTVSNMRLEEWREATRGPGEPSSGMKTPSWVWPPALDSPFKV